MRMTLMCLRNLFHRKARTSLCILGVALSVTFVMAVGATTTRYVTIIREMNVFYRGKLVVIARGSLFIQAVPIGGVLQESIVEDVQRGEGVKTVVPMLFIIGASPQIGLSQLIPSNFSVGIPSENWAALVGPTPIREGGRWPSNSSEEMEVVVGPYIFLESNLTLGSKLRINKYELRVVGVLDTPSVFLSRVVIMSLHVAQKVYHYEKLISMMVVEPDERISSDVLEQRIESELPGVKVLTEKERADVSEPLFRDIELWNMGVRSVLFSLSMVLVATVAMINVSERRRELATLDAIGAPRFFVIRVVLTETGFIGLLGGVAGIPLGVIVALLLASFYSNVPLSIILPDLWLIVSPHLTLEVLTSAVAVSCIAGVIPALIAIRKNASEALRSDH